MLVALSRNKLALRFCPYGMTVENSRIQLHGCNTARTFPWEEATSKSANISEQLSRELPGVIVEGYRGFGMQNALSLAIVGKPEFEFRFSEHTRTIGFTRSYFTPIPLNKESVKEGRK